MIKMKKVAKCVRALGMVGCAAMISPFAMADDTFWYIGGNIGQSRARIDDASIMSKLPGAASISDDNTDIAYKLFGGYQLHKNFAFEGGYFQSG